MFMTDEFTNLIIISFLKVFLNDFRSIEALHARVAALSVEGTVYFDHFWGALNRVRPELPLIF